jgi:HD superfamily phosphohydrolase
MLGVCSSETVSSTSGIFLGTYYDQEPNDVPSQSKYFRDPIHGLIEVDPKARYIIGSPLFQRLRGIKQLAFTYLVYHGAEHSRFGHSLGVYHLARTLTEHLKVNDSSVADAFCLAALLHDIGHFPFSHSFESVAKSCNNDLSHEKYTEMIIQHSEIADRLQKVCVDPKQVIEFIKGSFLRKPEFVFLNGLLDSELDIDRLDFLLRDSHYCGVTYGTYDLDRLILSMKKYQSEEVVISEKGIQSVEIYILARFSMYLQVYAHHTRRAFDLMLKSLFPKKEFESLGYPKPQIKEIDKIVDFDDSWLVGKIKSVAKGSSRRSLLAKEFLMREPIRWVCECLAFTDIREPGKRAMPAFTTLSNFCDSIEKKEKDRSLSVPLKEIWSDEPFKDMPFENRYRPFSYRGESEKGIIRVWRNQDEEPRDIAEVPNSLAFFLARNTAQMVRIYTTKKNRIKLREYLKQKFARFEEITWYSPSEEFIK